MSAEAKDRLEKIRRELVRVKSKNVAAFLSDFKTDLLNEGFGSDELSAIIIVATPTVMEMTMKGILK